MTTPTTSTLLQHRAWCTDTGHEKHDHMCGIAAVAISRCAVWANDHGQDGTDPRIVVDMPAGPYPGLTPAEARQMATELVRMADALEA